MKTDVHFWSYLAQLFLEWEMLRIEIIEEIKTQFMLSNFFLENHAVYEIMCENVVQPDRPQTAT